MEVFAARPAEGGWGTAAMHSEAKSNLAKHCKTSAQLPFVAATAPAAPAASRQSADTCLPAACTHGSTNARYAWHLGNAKS